MRGIEFEVVWFDQEVIEYRVVCSNGSFCGATKMYLAPGDLSKAADTLSGFPSSLKDSRNVRLGASDSNFAGGGIDMAFRCVDSAGHAVALVRLRADGSKGVGEPQSVCLYIPIEAGSIDSFVAKAQTVANQKGAKAFLHMADHTVGWIQRSFPNL
jgi:hypothetical protein